MDIHIVYNHMECQTSGRHKIPGYIARNDLPLCCAGSSRNTNRTSGKKINFIFIWQSLSVRAELDNAGDMCRH